MSSSGISVVFNNIKLPINASFEEAFSVATKKLSRLGISKHNTRFSVYKRSVDARRKDDIKFVYSVLCETDHTHIDERKLSELDAVKQVVSLPSPTFGDKASDGHVVVVGSGPAGMFAALILAENGYSPILLERGDSVCNRQRAVELFNRDRILDINSNIQFGAGGAGTFSDGKLVTRINDPFSSYVIQRLIEFGAPEDISYIAKPHVGTDVLSVVVDRILERIVELGGEVRYKTTFLSFRQAFGKINSVITDKGEIKTGALLLAIGHSARDTYSNLMQSQVSIEAKSFSVGMRIEHLADDIDRALYGSFASHPALGRAEYSLSTNTKVRGVYTFCMCPGGEVVAAASEEGGVVVNGMSNRNRDGKNSNSAVVCSVFREDYGATPESAIAFQREIEQRAFVAGGSDYSAPIITVGDFIGDACKTEPKRIQPTYMNGKGICLARPESYLPKFVTDGIRSAIIDFDRRIKGFAAGDAVLSGAETRTSSPIRITRDQDTRLALGYSNLYPAGEGAGYAGGITSAAIDGIRSALAIMSVYKPTHG